MAKKTVNIIIDTNIWVSYLITKEYTRLDRLLCDLHYKVLFSEELYEEFLMVTGRPKFSKYFEFNDIIRLLELFDTYGKYMKVVSTVSICRDQKDNFLLALAQDGLADYLITGDNDLLEMKQFRKTIILTINDFFSLTEK